MNNTTQRPYYECNDLFDNFTPELKDLFLRSCDIIWNNTFKLDSTTHDDLVTIARNIEFLVHENDEWHFSNPDLLYFGQALNFIYNKGLNTLPSEEVIQILIDTLRDNEEHDFDEQKNLTQYAFVHLINIFKRTDLLDAISSDELSDRIFWNTYSFFRECIPLLDVDLAYLGNFLISVAERGRDDIAGSAVYGATEQIGFTRPELGYELINFFSQEDNPVVVGFIESLMTGIANNSDEHTKKVITQSESWLHSGNSLLAQSALYSLQNLTAQQKYDPNLFIGHIPKLIDAPFEDLRIAIAFAVTRIGLVHEQIGEESYELLQQLKHLGPSGRVAHSISSSLSRERTLNSFGITCLQLLLDTPVEQKGTIQQIDMILYPLSESNPKLVWDFLKEWINQHDSEEPISQHDVFLNRINNLYSVSSDLALSVLTHWFISPDLQLVEESRLILRELNIQGFSTETIKNLTLMENIYAIEKVLAGGFDSSQISLLLISILRNTSYLEELSDYFQQALWYLAWNYPGGTGDVLTRSIEVEEDIKVKQILENAKIKLEKYQDEHHQIRDLFQFELAPSQRRVQKFREYEGKVFQQISQASMEDSRFPLLSIIPSVSVGRGNRSFHMEIFHPDISKQRTFSVPIEFGKISGSFELPKGEFLDPEGETRRRIQRLSLQLKDSQMRKE